MASEYEKKLIEMQYQLKVNNENMKDCFSELDNWSKEMTEKEKKLKENPSLLKNANKGLPPIRALTEKKKVKKKKKPVSGEDQKQQKAEEAKKTKKISSYDYRQWDKLDVDKMCEEVDQKPPTSSDEYTTDEEWEQEQLKVKAEWEKERGNQFFKDGLFNEAIECYTCAIGIDPTQPVYLANRAICLIKQAKYAAAEVDCTSAIALDSKYTKAYHRRATARVHLKKLEEARSDYEWILKAEPTSKLFQTELNNLNEMIGTNRLVFPVRKSAEQMSKKPLRRIQIEEIDNESAGRVEMQRNMEELNKKVHLTSKDKKLFEIIDNGDTQSDDTQSKSAAAPMSPSREELADASRVVESSKTSKLSELVESNELLEKRAKKASREPPPPPTNYFQFKKDWQSLDNNIESLTAYFKNIKPESYQKLFLNGLESDHISKIFIIFKNMLIDPSKDVFVHLKCLASVKRFQTQLMFLSAADKQNLNELFAHIRSTTRDNDALEALMRLYEM